MPDESDLDAYFAARSTDPVANTDPERVRTLGNRPPHPARGPQLRRPRRGGRDRRPGHHQPHPRRVRRARCSSPRVRVRGAQLGPSERVGRSRDDRERARDTDGDGDHPDKQPPRP